jgi:hypothetical protein
MISIPRGGVDAAAEAPLGNRSWEISLAQTSLVDPVDDLWANINLNAGDMVIFHDS